MLFDPKEVKDLILQDYDNAVLTILWCIDNSAKRKLIFSTIEFYPKECVVPTTTEEQTVRIKMKNKTYVRLFFRCICLNAFEALTLYENCQSTQAFPMIWETKVDKNGEQKIICTTSLLALPAWPAFSLVKREDVEVCPFLSEKWGACRTSHLLTTDPNSLLVQLLEYENSVEWIKNRLLWNLNEYPELIGSMHLVLPNPLFRYMEEHLLPGKKGEPDQVKLNLALRENQKLEEATKILTAERSFFGILNTQFKDVTRNSATVVLAGRAEEFAAAVCCPKRGLLDYTNFGTFWRSLRFDLQICDAIRIVNVPGTDNSYSVTMGSQVQPIHVGETDDATIPEIELGKRIGYRVRQCEQAKTASNFGQKLFAGGSSEEAQSFIRGLVQKARKRVVVVDPYFSTIDFYRYICAISSPKIEISILTSSLILKEISDLGAASDSAEVVCKESLSSEQAHEKCPEKGEELLMQIKKYGNSLSYTGVSVSVMTGDQPLIHDRFLVIDDAVWFTGNSLNHLGERASMILRLPNPTEVLRLIDVVFNDEDRVKSLEKWVADRKKAVAEQRKKNEEHRV